MELKTAYEVLKDNTDVERYATNGLDTQDVIKAMKAYAAQWRAATPIPEAQQLEGVKTAQINIGETSITKLVDGCFQVVTKNGCVELYPDELTALFTFTNAQFATEAMGWNKQLLTDCQELLMNLIALNHVPDEVCPDMNDMISRIDDALSAPSTHSSSEMVGKDKLIKDLQRQLKTQANHKDSLKQYWLSCAESKKKWLEAIKEYFDSEHTESIQSFEDFKEQFDLED